VARLLNPVKDRDAQDAANAPNPAVAFALPATGGALLHTAEQVPRGRRVR
jgi:hypothetical protein